MNDLPRKRSPRAPSLPLDEALERAMKAYERERLHPAPTDVMAQHLGYRNASNGAALTALASLRYFGLIERPKDGFLSVSKNVEAYKFAPDTAMKRALLLGFLRNPALYADLLAKYESGLPSEANIKFELIQRGFGPSSADSVLAAFLKSVHFANYYAQDEAHQSEPADVVNVEHSRQSDDLALSIETAPTSVSGARDDGEYDRIPVRLQGGRRAWITVPAQLLKADKLRLKAQIDLILAEDETT